MAALNDEEQEVIRQRLIAKEAEINSPWKEFQLRALTESFLKLSKTTGENGAFDAAGYDVLLEKLKIYEFYMNKEALVARRTQVELEEYSETRKQINKEIETAKADIASLKAELETEKRIRQNKEEIESVKHIINQFPSREESQKEIDDLKKSLDGLKYEQEKQMKNIDIRNRQFQLLLQSIYNLQQELDDPADGPEPNQEMADVEMGEVS